MVRLTIYSNTACPWGETELDKSYQLYYFQIFETLDASFELQRAQSKMICTPYVTEYPMFSNVGFDKECAILQSKTSWNRYREIFALSKIIEKTAGGGGVGATMAPHRRFLGLKHIV